MENITKGILYGIGLSICWPTNGWGLIARVIVMILGLNYLDKRKEVKA